MNAAPDPSSSTMELAPLSVAAATRAAATAFPIYSRIEREARAAFLDAIAEEIEALGDVLIETAARETNLPIARLTGERGRTCAQLRMFAKEVRSGSFLDIRIETADPSRAPLPKPDLRRMMVPLGPIAVFGASNFPLAFSVPGGDTASALAAGCSVVAKAHPAHPVTSRLAGTAIARAVERLGLPDGVFSLVEGGIEAGEALVLSPHISGVGFTGSYRAGCSLLNLVARRQVPIPVFAEMGSVNPLFVLPGAITERGEALAQGYVGSLTLGVGQFCTNPGVVIGIGAEFETWTERLPDAIRSLSAGKMLTPGIASAFAHGLTERCAHPKLATLVQSEGGAVHRTSGTDFLAYPELSEELFGPAAIAVVAQDADELKAIAAALEGQLTATLQISSLDHGLARDLLSILRDKAGRLVVNGFPTGVEVNSAMQHGGPFPASTDSRFTSVGTAAVERWLRPVAYQDVPSELLPRELQNP